MQNESASSEGKKPKGCWSLARRVLVGLLVVLALLLVFTTLRASVLDPRALGGPMPDSSLMVDIGGRDIHLVAMGLENDGPAVVLLPCLNCGSIYWQLVQPELAETMRVYAFDPAGFAWSQPHPDRLSVASAADDLHDALVALGEEEIVLVAYSGSGITALNYLDRYDEPRVLGLVSMEAELFSETGEAAFGGGRPFLPPGVQRGATALGVGRVFFEVLVMPGSRETFTPIASPSPLYDLDAINRLAATYPTRKVLYAAIDIEATYSEAVRQSSGLAVPGDIPVFAIDCDWAPTSERLSEKQARQLRDDEARRAGIWRALAENSPGGRYIEVEDATHFLPVERPEVPVEVIGEMWELVRR